MFWLYVKQELVPGASEGCFNYLNENEIKSICTLGTPVLLVTAWIPVTSFLFIICSIVCSSNGHSGSFFREPARLTQLTEKSRLFWLQNGSLKNKCFNYDFDYDGCENNSN